MGFENGSRPRASQGRGHGLVLWHIPFSHYNEKARWALEYKGVEHERREAMGGLHPLVSLWKTRGRSYTFPLLVIDGRAIGDSTAIIAALENRFPSPPLYPTDPAQRRRALGLEDFFDEELAPFVRRFVFHEVTHDPASLTSFARRAAHPRLERAANPKLLAFVLHARFRTRTEKAAEESKRKIVAALDRLEAELDEGEYLVGDSFTVADLTAASLLYPLVLPPEGPDPGFRIPDGVIAFREQLGRRRGLDYVKQMFRRHRLPRPERWRDAPRVEAGAI